MSYSHSSPHHHHDPSRRPLTSVSRHEARITPQNYQPVAHITITNVSSRDLIESLLRRQDVAQDNFNAPSSPDYFQEASELIVDEDSYTEEKQDDAILLEYFKTRTHCVARPNNPIETEEICAICQTEFKHGESIRTLGCKHEYHTGCIKQWLLRKKDCPMCRSPVLRMHST